MIKIKLTKMGGYVIGDGPCPFDPDDFMLLFGNKMLEAQAQGLTEIGFSDEMVEQFCAENKVAFRKELQDAPVLELPDADATPQRLLEAMDA